MELKRKEDNDNMARYLEERERTATKLSDNGCQPRTMVGRLPAGRASKRKRLPNHDLIRLIPAVVADVRSVSST